MMVCNDPYRFTIDNGPEQVVHCTDAHGHDDWHVYSPDGEILMMWNGSQSGDYRNWEGPRAKQALNLYG